MSKPQGRISALALAAAVALGVASSDAQALALGRISVQSALGEPLRVDIDIPEINAEEASSLRANVASPQAFRAAGLEYSPALSAVEITLQRRPDGRYFLRLVSSRAVNEPFVDLILETTWSSGRIVRDYTMLFDPPNLRQGTAPLSAQVSPVPSPGAVQGTPTPTPRAAPVPRATAPAAPRTRSAAAPSASPAPAPAPRPAAAPTPSGDGKQVTAKDGDNATKIAKANLHANISLDQMLIALLRANPDAFAGNNINRLKSGAVLEIPSAAQAAEVDTKEANQVLVAQSRDFDEFRRRLAEGLPVRDMRSADRVSSGRIQATVEDKKPAAASPDRLTLSKGAIQGKAGEDKIARDRAAQEAATRVAELNKNISELNKLGTATGSGTAPAGAASAARPGIAVPAGMAASAARPAASAPAPATQPAPMAAVSPASAPAPAAAPVAAASAPEGGAAANAPAASVSAPSATASAAEAPAATASAAPAPVAAPAAKPKPRVAPIAPPPETSVLDDLLDNPLIPAAAVGVLAMLLGLGFYKLRQRRKATQVDSSFLESRLQPDSFFGASGGQRIDTAEGASQTGSSMVYSPSQLDAAGDVDPVAEADVYLAYGRDLQAEEILKEALRTNPGRVAIHAKLLEIYAKRRDAKAFEVLAAEAYGLTHGEGPEWEHICELGRELDPANPMYRPGGQPGEDARAAAAATVPGAFSATTAIPAAAPEAAAPNVDLDLDLDFSLGDDQPAAAPVPERTVAMDQRTQAVEAPAVPSLEMDFGKPAAPAPQPEPVRLDAPDLTLNESSLNFSASPAPAPAPQPAVAAPAAAADAGMIEFDLGALSLDLDNGKKKEGGDTDEAPLSTAGAPLITADLSGDDSSDPLATKLALAEEFNAIGDPDGARSLAEEVVAEASGDLKTRAQRLLAEIG